MKQRNSDSVFKLLFERTSTRVAIGALGLLVLATVALMVLQRCGLMLINGAMMFCLPLLTLFVLLVWGISALVRRIDSRAVKILVGGVLGLLLAMGLVLLLTYILYMAPYVTPQRYSTMTSPSGGHRLVVLRTFDLDEERIEARRAARVAANPDADPEVIIQDWGYVYQAYPQVMGLFYRADADVEGEIHLAFSDLSTEGEGGETPATQTIGGTLMVEWLDDGNTAHFFVENPGVAEGGECTLKF